jgi:ADP-heptose:LPS heptosyltransferase
MTPREAVWYVTNEMRDYVETHSNITLMVKQFSCKEITGIIKNAQVFCTVNTGLLWLGIMLDQKIVVCDTYTDFEWNPSPYKNVTRLAHDFDEQGKSLHLVTREYPDGIYFESMYRVEPKEVVQALSLFI